MAVTDRIEGLYSTEQRGLLSLAWLILGSREAAEDAVQECFARLGVRGIDDIDNPAGYLRSMCSTSAAARSGTGDGCSPPPRWPRDCTSTRTSASSPTPLHV